MTPMPNGLLIELRDIFATQFSSEDLADFCLDLGIDYEDLAGDSRKAKARELAQYIGRRQMFDKLAEVGVKRRPEIAWGDILSRYGLTAAQPQVIVPSGKLVSPADLQKITAILADRPMFLTPDGRRSTLVLAGVNGMIAVDLNGNAQTVAANVVTGLNQYGRTAGGDPAVKLLLDYLIADSTVPLDERAELEAILEHVRSS